MDPRSRPATLAAAFLLVSAPARAQLFDPGDVRALGATQLAPPSGGGPAHEVLYCVAAELTGDARRDAVLLAGASARLAWAPGSYTALPLIAHDVGSIGVITSSTARAAWVLTLGATSGLERHVYDPAQSRFVAQTLGSSAFQGASALCTADLDGAGLADVAALGAGGTSVRLLTDLAGTPAEASFVLPSSASAMVALDWSGAPASELAIVHGGGVWIYRQTGVQLASFAVTGSVRLAVLARTIAGHERLAAVVRDGGEDVLYVAGSAAGVSALALGDQQVLALAAGDLDGDGRTDLVATRATSGDPLYLLQQADGAFALGASGTIALGSPAAHGEAQSACIGDFDSDGDADVLAGAPALDDLVLARNQLVDAAANAAHVVEHRMIETLHEGGAPPSFELELDLALGAEPLAGATHVEITGWIQTDAEGGPATTALERVLVPIAPENLSARIAIADEPTVLELHALDVREVVVDAAGQVLGAGPSSHACFSGDVTLLEAFCAARGIDYALVVDLSTWVLMLPGGIFGVTSRLDSGIVPMGDIPIFPEDDEEPPDEKKVPDPQPQPGG